jgi:hypothetical protein
MGSDEMQWMNRFRRLLVRWDKRSENYLALLHLACGIIASRATGLVGGLDRGLAPVWDVFEDYSCGNRKNEKGSGKVVTPA